MQVGLHLVSVAAVFLLVRNVLESREIAKSKSNWLAAIGAIAFGVHPLQVESVAFIGTMNTPLADALALVAMVLYLKAVVPVFNRKLYWLSTAIFAAALLCKPTAIVAPALVVVLEHLISERTWKQCAKTAIPWFVLIIPCAIWTKISQPADVLANPSPLWGRPLVISDALVFYIGKLIVPLNLGIDYGRTPKHVLDLHSTWIVWTIPAALAGLAWTGRKRFPIAVTGAAVFFIALIPNSGLVSFDYQYASTTTDRYVYFPMLGVAMIVGAIASKMKPAMSIVIFGILMSGWIVATEFQIRTWRDGDALFRHALTVNPNSWMSESNLAMIVRNRDPQESIRLSRHAVKVHADAWVAHNNLAVLLVQQDPDEAVRQSQYVIHHHPTLATDAYNNLGCALRAKGDLVGASNAFAESYKREPENEIYAENYADSLETINQHSEAANIYRKILAKNPKSQSARAGVDRTTGAATTKP